jgi:hypothetical protein
MPLRHAVPLTPSVSLRLSQLLCHKENEQGNFHSPYTLPSSVSHKSFTCHSYENTGGVGAFFPFWFIPSAAEGNSSDCLTTPILVLSFHTLTNCKIFQLLCFDIHTKLPGGYPPSTLRLSDIRKFKQCFDLSPFHSSTCALFCTQENPNSFPFNRFRTLCEKPPGVGGYSTSSTFERSDFRTFRRVPHFPKSAIFSIQ